MKRAEKVKYLLSNPEEMLQKKPFYRGFSLKGSSYNDKSTISINGTRRVRIPSIKKYIITQDDFLKELEPMSHKVLYDQNVPSITMKTDTGGYVEIQYQKMAVSFQKNIKNKQVMHLCGNPMQFTMMETEPTEQQEKDFVTIKQYWELRNMDGFRTQMVDRQKSVGDAGMLFYYNEEGEVKVKILSYMDGYILCPHNDDSGDRALECVYYMKDDIEYIDAYDNTYMYRYSNDGTGDIETLAGWRLIEQEAHGFPEIPLITKRGDVAWNNAQSVIETYEIIYNIFMVIQKRHGWGILYIKGRFEDSGKRIAGSIILNDKTSAGTGEQSDSDAKFLTPPTPQGTLDTLQLLEETIQKCASTTFLLPKDVKVSGDVSGIAIQLTQSMDLENALQGVIEWQNVANKMVRLFKAGLAKELVRKGIQPTAITDFDNLNMNAKFKVWRPKSDSEVANILQVLVQNGILSAESATEASPITTPNEKARLRKEKEQKILDALEQQQQGLAIQAAFAEQSTNNNNESNSNNNNSNSNN